MKNAKVLFILVASVALFQSRASIAGGDALTDVINHGIKVTDSNTRQLGTGRRVGSFDGEDGDEEGSEDGITNGKDTDGGDVADEGPHTTAQDDYLASCADGPAKQVGQKKGGVLRTASGFAFYVGSERVTVTLQRSEFGTRAEVSAPGASLNPSQIHKIFRPFCG